MFGGSKLVTEIADKQGTQVVEFDITGIESAIKSLRNACNW